MNKKQKFPDTCKYERNVELNRPASSGGEGKNIKCVSCLWPPLEATLSVLKLSLFFVKKMS
jgi:hypothetical protein